MLVGENGVLNNAKNSRVSTEAATVEEEVKLATTLLNLEITKYRTRYSSYDAANFINTTTDGNITVAKSLVDILEGELTNTYYTITPGTGKITVAYSSPTYAKTYELTVTRKLVTLGDAGSGEEPGGGSGEEPGSTPLAEDAVETLAKSGAIKRWDKVNYNPGTGTTASLHLPVGASIEGKKLASLSLPAGATLEGTIDASDATNWVVLDVNETTGEVLIMPKTVSDVALTLEGKDGYNNGVEAINMVASIYINSAYAESARGLTIEDLNKVMEHTPDGEEATYTWNHRYGMNPTTLDITDAGEGNTPSQDYESTAETGYYYYSIASLFGSNNNCWLASRCVRVYSDDCYFNLRYLCNYGMDVAYLFGVAANGYAGSNDYGFPVVPVVSLKSEVQVKSSETFYTETATATVTVAEQDEDHTYEHNTWTFK